MNKEGIQILTLAGMVVIIAAVAGYGVGKATAEREFVPVPPQEVVVEPVEEVQEIITVVDGVGCVMEPYMTFAKDTGYVTVTLVCDTDFLYNYLPAVEVEVEDE